MNNVLVIIMVRTVVCHVAIAGKENIVTHKMEPVMTDVRQVIWEKFAGQNAKMVIMEKTVT